ncbi:MAG: sulfotransferase [Prochloraceae cyanobacterium]|nr:sulfotransferase [Prochloraceae cyanobacterium]
MLNQEKTLIFIVGNSRSGTTMMSRIVGKHPQVFSFNELHFFGELWAPDPKKKVISNTELQLLMAKLLCIQRDGYLTQGNPEVFFEEAGDALREIPVDNISPATLFQSFLMYESRQKGKLIPCEHTPGNVFYIEEILELYPQAKIINMIRDPRDVLLSQKRKWKRRFLGAKKIPLREAIRSKVNYHPVTISKLWNAAVGAAEKFTDRDRVYSLRFEELLEKPEVKVREIYDFLDLSFDNSFLEVPQIGSSSASDRPTKKGIDSNKAGNWQKGGLSSTEIFLCQQITKDLRKKYSYHSEPINPNYLELIYSLFSLPFQLTLALFLNFNRMSRIADTIKRRLT